MHMVHKMKCLSIFGCALVALLAFGVHCARAAAPEPVDPFNYVIGTQTFSPSYHFTAEPGLVETARAILAMGSNTIKFRMGADMRGDNLPPTSATLRAPRSALTSLTDQAAHDPAVRRVLEMPFAYIMVWATPFATEKHGPFSARRSAADDDAEYRELHDLTRHLLTTYNGSGKTFFLGHWEGDWLLLGRAGAKGDPAPERIAAMARWLKVRQRAVEDARRDTPHRGVEVYHYTEVNLVQKSLQGAASLARDVLPQVNVDYVSYSSYDSLKGDTRANLKKALDYIESKMKPKPEIQGKRVFIGEYGFPAIRFDPRQQDAQSREVMRAALEWGCPFALYWEMYNNEVDPQQGQRGFWLIDDKGAKAPVYFTHQRFYARVRRFVADYQKKNGRAPSDAEFRKAALEFLEDGTTK